MNNPYRTALLALTLLAGCMSHAYAAGVPLAPEWVRVIGLTDRQDHEFEQLNAFAMDAHGRFYGAGSRRLIRFSQEDLFVRAFNTDWSTRWTDEYDADIKEWVRPWHPQSPVYDRRDQANAVCVGPHGGILVTGQSYNVPAFNRSPYPVQYFNSGDLVTIKYDASGKREWLRRWRLPKEYGSAANGLFVSTDAGGGVHVVGSAVGLADSPGDGSRAHPKVTRPQDCVYLRYSADGTQKSATSFGAGFYPRSARLGRNGAMTAVVETTEPGPDYGWTLGPTDLAVVTFDANGKTLGSRHFDIQPMNVRRAFCLLDRDGNTWALHGSGEMAPSGPVKAWKTTWTDLTKFDSEGRKVWTLPWEADRFALPEAIFNPDGSATIVQANADRLEVRVVSSDGRFLQNRTISQPAFTQTADAGCLPGTPGRSTSDEAVKAMTPRLRGRTTATAVIGQDAGGAAYVRFLVRGRCTNEGSLFLVKIPPLVPAKKVY